MGFPSYQPVAAGRVTLFCPAAADLRKAEAISNPSAKILSYAKKINKEPPIICNCYYQLQIYHLLILFI